MWFSLNVEKWIRKQTNLALLILEVSISSFLKVFLGVKNDLVKQENGVFVARSIKNGYGGSI